MSFKCSFTSHKLCNNYCIINIMALIAIIIFSLTALVGRVVFHYKLTGTSGIKFERKSLSSTSFSIYSVLVGVGFYGIIILSILEVLDKFNAQFNLGINGIILGWAIVLLGLLITMMAQYQMGASWRYIGSKSNDTKLITHGLFKYSRNPIYAGGLIFFIGVVILLPDYLVILFFIFIYAGLEILVRYQEEPNLKEIHGDIFEDYCRKVNRFIPKIF